MLHREGEEINIKRVHRIWKSEGLTLPIRRPRRRQYGPKGESLRKAEYPLHVWTYDILEDRTERGSRLRILTVLDEYTRESLAIWVGRSVSAQTVVENLKWLFMDRGTPEHIRSDNGPEFIAKAVRDWLAESGCKTIVIENWREEYNRYRPHSSLGYLTPIEFAERCGKGAASEPPPEEVGIDILQTLTL